MKKIVALILVAVMVMSLSIVAFAAKLGDVNGNGKVQASDALMVLQSVAGTRTLTAAEKKRADADKNGTVTANDARKILQTVAGILSEEEIKEEGTTEDSIDWNDIVNAGKQ